jgi:hypothetical protein
MGNLTGIDSRFREFVHLFGEIDHDNDSEEDQHHEKECAEQRF